MRWRKREAAKEEERAIERRKVELQEMEAKLTLQQEQVARQMAEFQRMMAGGTIAVVRPTPW